MEKEQKKNVLLEITEEMIEKADSYIPLEKKMSFARLVAPDCVEKVEMSVQKAQSDATLTLPQMWREKTELKQLYLLQFFLREYLHIDVPDNFGTSDYNAYAKFHPICQLERFKYKSSPAIKDKVYDLLSDFRDLKRFLEVEIHSELANRNDPLERFLAGVTLLSSSENIKELLTELQQKSSELEGKLKQRNARRKTADAKKVEAEKGKGNETNVE